MLKKYTLFKDNFKPITIKEYKEIACVNLWGTKPYQYVLLEKLSLLQWFLNILSFLFNVVSYCFVSTLCSMGFSFELDYRTLTLWDNSSNPSANY